MKNPAARISPLLTPRTLLGLAILIFLVYLTIIPVLSVAVSGFTAEGFSLFATSPSLDNFQKLTGQTTVIFNTIVYTAGAALLTTIIAVFLAWTISRTNAPLRRVYFYLVFLSFFLPPIIWEQTWLRLFGRGGLYPTLLGLRTLPIQSLGGMIVVQSIRMAALGMIILIPLFASMDRSLEESGRISGASIFQTTTRITIPMIAPGVITVALLVSLITLGTVRVPLVLGVPAGIDVLATAMYEAARTAPTDYGIAMAEALLLILLAIPLLFAYRRYLGQADRFQTVSGRGFQSKPIDIGTWRYAVSAITGFYLLVTIVIPALLMVYASFLTVYTSPLSVDIASFSFEAYTGVINDPDTWMAFQNSLLVAAIATTLTVFGGAAISWITKKSDLRFKRSIEYSAFIPIAIPSTALALGISFVYLHIVPIDLYGTLAIIVIAFLIRTLPISTRIIEPGVLQIGDSLLEIAQLSGASRARRVFSIILPMITGAVASTWAVFFAFLMLELPIVIMLYTAQTNMLSVQLYSLFLDGQMTQGAALGVILMGVLLVVTILVHQIGDRVGA